METKGNRFDYVGFTLFLSLFLALAYGGWLSYKSIDWEVLKRMEKMELDLPTPIPTATSSATPTSKPIKK